MKLKKVVIALAIMQLAGSALAAGGTAADGSYAVSVQPAVPAASNNGGPSGTAVGAGSNTYGADSVAVGTNAAAQTHSVAVGGNATAGGQQSVAVGDQTVASGNYSTSIGQQTQATGQDAISIGNMTTSQGDGAVAIGTSASTSSAAAMGVAVGGGATVNALNGVAIGMSATVQPGADNSVALGAGSVATQPNTISVGSVGNERRITNVATPINATDAANKAYVDNAVAGVSSAGVDELRGRVNGLENRINEVDRKVSGGVAIALAIASPVSLSPGESAISVGTGGFGGQGAIAVSFGHSFKLEGTKQPQKNELGEVIEEIKGSKTEPWIFKEAIFSAGVGGSSAGDVGVRASMSFKF